MKIGRLRQRITLQYKVVTRDAVGGEVITWTDQETIWASAEPLRGRDFFSAQQAQSDVSIRFTLRYRAYLNGTYRVKWRDQYFEIVGEPIEINGRLTEHQLMCRTMQNV